MRRSSRSMSLALSLFALRVAERWWDEMPTVPQYQKSKGVLIMTAALELSQNQITHFYSPRKDTGEMLRMLARLVDQYKYKSQIYVSWDAASWHMSKMLRDHVAQLNERIMKERGVPSRFVLEFDWRGLRSDEDTWSGSKVNRLIGEFLGQA